MSAFAGRVFQRQGPNLGSRPRTGSRTLIGDARARSAEAPPAPQGSARGACQCGIRYRIQLDFAMEVAGDVAAVPRRSPLFGNHDAQVDVTALCARDG